MAQHMHIQIREKVKKYSMKEKTSHEIASLLKIGKSTLNFIAKYCCGYGLKDHPCSERPRIVSKKVDLTIKCNLAADVKKNADKNLAKVSRSTVTQRLHDVKFLGHIGIYKPLIRKKNQKAQLQFAKDHQPPNLIVHQRSEKSIFLSGI